MLDNIVITISDLEAVVPKIESLKFDTQPNFDEIIKSMKQKLYGMIKQDYIGDYKLSDYLELSSIHGTNADIDTTLEDVRDYPEEKYLKNRLVRMIIAEIYKQNEDFDTMDVYLADANTFPIKYYIDTDLSETAGISEEVTGRRFMSFHR